MTSSSSQGDDGFGGVSRFVVVRIFSLVYFAAFLSLLAQVDGLFGCNAIYPPKALLPGLPIGLGPLIISLGALLGAVVAGISFLAVGICRHHSVAIFGFLWVCFAVCVELAPALYPQLEDKLLLETGLVAIFLAASGEGPVAVTARTVGRVLAAWLLFRSIFSSGADKVTGSCGVWRDLSALRNVYQLEAFPLPTVWLTYMAPQTVVQGLTFLQLYIEIGLCPLVLAPSRLISRSAALAQLVVLGVSCALANKGLSPVCQVALILCLLDDKWHRGMWSYKILFSWGYRIDDEDDGDDGEAIWNDGDEEKRSGSICYVILLFLVGFIASFPVAISYVAGIEEQGASGVPQVRWACGCSLCIAAGIAVVVSLVTLVAGIQAADRAPSPFASRRFAVSILGISIWTFGLLQLGRDILPLSLLPQPIHAVSQGLERLHIAHAHGRGANEPQPCPRSEGRLDLLVQGTGSTAEFEHMGGDRPRTNWLSFSSRHVPCSEERRPTWLTPYTPRMDKEFWRLAQKIKPKKAPVGEPQSEKFRNPELEWEVPKWTLRLISSLSLREGASAALAAGSWRGLGAMIHGPALSGQYEKLPTPLPVLYIKRTTHQPMEDKHSNKWWKQREGKILRLLEEPELRKLSKKFAPKCQPLPWAEWPVAEALMAVVIAAFLGKICSPAATGKRCVRPMNRGL